MEPNRFHLVFGIQPSQQDSLRLVLQRRKQRPPPIKLCQNEGSIVAAR
jgi:hypothetical protein